MGISDNLRKSRRSLLEPDTTRLLEQACRPEASRLFSFEGLEQRTMFSTVAQWHFDASTGSTAIDSSGNSHTATLYGGASFAVGRIGNALNLDGGSGYADAGGAVVNTASSYTISAWVRLSSVDGGGNETFLSQDGTANSAFYLQWVPGTGFRFQVNASNGAWVSAASQTQPVAGQWYHLAGVYNATSQQIQLYVNGQLQNSAVLSSPASASGDTIIGAGKWSGSRVDFVGGEIDDARADNAALNQAQIQTLMNTAAQWRFDAASGSTAADASGNNHIASLAGGASFAGGRVGNALTLNGSTGYADAGGPVINTTSSYSVSAWVRLNSVSGGNQTFISQDDSSNSGFYLQWVPSTGFRFQVNGANGAWVSAVSQTQAVPGQWYHVAGVYNTFSGQIQILVNGKLESTAAVPYGASSATGNTIIGAGKWSGSRVDYVNGQVDEARVDSVALSQDQIQILVTTPAQWRFDANGGNTAVDASGNNRTATLSANGTSLMPGRVGNALTLTGSGGYADAGGPVINTTFSYTVSVWVKLISLAGGNETILSQDGASNSGFYLQWVPNIGFRFQINTSTGGWASVVSQTQPNAGQWYHVAGVYDSSAQQIQLYVNGQVQGAAAVSSPANATGNTIIGAAQWGGARVDYVNGQIDDARMDSSALTAAQVQSLANLPNGWSDGDIGSPAVPGGATLFGGKWTVSGSGSDIGGASDQFNLAQTSYSGDGTFVAYVSAVSDSAAKAGLMFRNDLTASSAFAAVLVDSSQQLSFQWRDSAGAIANTVSVARINAPVWLNLVRTGNNFSAYYSVNGSNWMQIGSTQTVTMTASAIAGMGVTSRSTTAVSTASFNNLQLNAVPLPLGRVQATVVGGTDVQVSWLQGDASATSYKVAVSSDGESWTPVGSAPAGATSYLATGVSPNATLEFQVTPSNGSGDGASAISNSVQTQSSQDEWYFVSLPNGGTFIHGDAGDTSTGQLTSNPTASSASPWIEAGSPLAAIYQALTGSITDTVTGDTYSFPSSGAFRYNPDLQLSGVDVGPAIVVEDHYGEPGSDYDYNDDYVPIKVQQLPHAKGPVVIVEGTQYQLNLDPGLNEGVASWSVDWGDGNSDTAPAATTLSHLFGSGVTASTVSAAALDANGTTLTTSTIDVRILPATPQNLSATVMSPHSVQLNWLNTSLLADSVIVEESTDGINFFALASVAPGDQTYVVTGLRSLNTAYFRICTRSSLGASPYSNTASATPMGVSIRGDTLAPNGATYSLDLSWSDPESHPVTSWNINWGDGSAVESLPIDATNASHSYSGTHTGYLVTAWVSDGTNIYEAEPLALDPAFGSSGNVLTQIGVSTSGSTVRTTSQADGKLLVVTSSGSNLSITRYNSDGSLDDSFGASGTATMSVAGNIEIGGIALQPDGRILVSGTAQINGAGQLMLARFSATDGSADTGFGDAGTGVVTSALGHVTVTGAGVTVMPGGDIVVVGSADSYPAVAAFNSVDGSLDQSFGSGGQVVLSDVAGSLAGVALSPEGKLVAVGATGSGFLTVRLNQDSSRDTSFGDNGVTVAGVSGFGAGDGATRVFVQADDKILVDGIVQGQLVLVRIDGDGSADTSFGSAGAVLTGLRQQNSVGSAVQLQADGRVTVGGYAPADGGAPAFTLLRYDGQGATDPSFGFGGTLPTEFHGGDNGSYDLTVEADGRIVVAGYAADGLALARYGYLDVAVVTSNVTLSGPDSVYTGDTYTVSFDTSAMGQDTTESWTLDWGDGTSSEGTGELPPSADHIYTDAGDYSLSLIAKNIDGSYNEAQLPLQAADAPANTAYSPSMVATSAPTNPSPKVSLDRSNGIVNVDMTKLTTSVTLYLIESKDKHSVGIYVRAAGATKFSLLNNTMYSKKMYYTYQVWGSTHGDVMANEAPGISASFFGGAGNDTFLYYPTATTYSGGGGNDTVDASYSPSPEWIDIDDVTGNVHTDITNFIGTPGGDTFTINGNGNNRNYVFMGHGGSDTFDVSTSSGIVRAYADGSSGGIYSNKTDLVKFRGGQKSGGRAVFIPGLRGSDTYEGGVDYFTGKRIGDTYVDYLDSGRMNVTAKLGDTVVDSSGQSELIRPSITGIWGTSGADNLSVAAERPDDLKPAPVAYSKRNPKLGYWEPEIFYPIQLVGPGYPAAQPFTVMVWKDWTGPDPDLYATYVSDSHELRGYGGSDKLDVSGGIGTATAYADGSDGKSYSKAGDVVTLTGGAVNGSILVPGITGSDTFNSTGQGLTLVDYSQSGRVGVGAILGGSYNGQTVDASIHAIYGTTGDDNLSVSASVTPDRTYWLYGVGGNDILTGGGVSGSTSYLVPGGAGNDTLQGGAGDAFVDYARSGRTGVVVQIGGAYGGQTISSNVAGVLGTNGNDNISVAASVTPGRTYWLYGVGGNDILTGGGVSGSTSYLVPGGAGNDTLQGGAGDALVDYLDSGRTGVAVVIGGTSPGGQTISSDVAGVLGTNGNDNISVAASASRGYHIFGEGGDDSLIGSLGNDSIDGGGGNDVITEPGGNNTLLGGQGNNTITGGSGDDLIYASDQTQQGSGTNSSSGGGGNDTIYGAAGVDTISTATVSSTVDGGAGSDVVTVGQDVTGGLGNTWTEHAGGFTEVNGVISPSIAGDNVATIDSGTARTDVIVSAKLICPAGQTVGLIARYNSGSYYVASTDSSGGAIIYRVQNGTLSPLQNTLLPGATTTDVPTNGTFRFEVTGGSAKALLRLFVDDQLCIDASDATPLGPGSPGFYAKKVSSSSDNVGATISSFVARAAASVTNAIVLIPSSSAPRAIVWAPGVALSDIMTGDFNGDGHADAIGRDPQHGVWYVGISSEAGAQNTVFGTWSPATTWTNIVVADFNGDGLADVAGEDANGQWQVSLSDGSKFSNSASTPTKWSSDRVFVGAADVNGDHRADLISYSAGSDGSLTWYVDLSSGTGFTKSTWATVPALTSFATPSTWVNPIAGDFDGDGRMDIAARDSTTGKWYVGLSDGNRFVGMSPDTPWGGVWLPGSYSDVLVGDFTGDGKDDIIGRQPTSPSSWQIAASTGTAFAWQASCSIGITLDSGVQVADLDGDGKADLFGTQGGSYYASLGGSSASIAWRGTASGLVSSSPQRVLVGNFFDQAQAAAQAFQLVHNTIRFEPYAGSMKNPTTTLATGGGNDWDQAALLIDQLAAAGIAARYKTLEIVVDKGSSNYSSFLSQLKQWLGVRSDDAVYATLYEAGLIDTTNYSPTVYQVYHTVVEAYVPGPHGLRWADMDPSWKAQDLHSALWNNPDPSKPNIQSITSVQKFNDDGTNGYLTSTSTTLADEFYANDVQTWLAAYRPGTSLADVPYAGAIVQQHYSAVPDGLSYPVAGNATQLYSVPSSQLHTVQVTLQQVPQVLYSGTAGLHMYFTIKSDQSGMYWNGTSFETYIGAHWDRYANALVDTLGDGNYRGDFLARDDGGTYTVVVYQQAGATVATSDSERKTLSAYDPAWTTLLRSSLNLPSVGAQAVIVSYLANGDKSLMPQLRVGSLLVSSGAKVALGAGVVLHVADVDDPQHPGNYPRVAGQDMAIGLDAGQISDTALFNLQKQLNVLADAVYSGTAAQGQYEDLLLAYGEMKYLHDVRKEVDWIGSLTGMLTLHQDVASGVMTGNLDPYEDHIDLKLSTAYFPSGLLTDNASLRFEYQPIDSAQDRTRLLDPSSPQSQAYLIAHETTSGLENRIIEELTNEDAASTVKAFQWVAEQNAGPRQAEPIQIYVLSHNAVDGLTHYSYYDTPNVDAGIFDFKLLALPANAVENIKNDINSSYTVTVPASEIKFGSGDFAWSGAVWTRWKLELNSLSYYYGNMIEAENSNEAHGGYGYGQSLLDPINSDATASLSMGDPVTLATGNMTHDEQDISLPGVGLPANLSRHYDSLTDEVPSASLAAVDRGLGVGWTGTYFDYLSFGKASIIAANVGVGDKFTVNVSGSVTGSVSFTATTTNASDVANGLKAAWNVPGVTATVDGNYLVLMATAGASVSFSTSTTDGNGSSTQTLTGNASVYWNTSDGLHNEFKASTLATGAGTTFTDPAGLFGTFAMESGGYYYKDRDGTEYHFAAVGPFARLNYIQDRNGNRLNCNYTGNTGTDTLVSVTDNNPQHTAPRLTFAFNGPAGHLGTVTDYAKRTWTYGYISMVDPVTGQTKYYLSQVTTPAPGSGSGLVMNYTYYSSGLLFGLMKTITDASDPSGPANHTYDYYPSRRAFAVTDPLGHTEYFTYDPFHNSATHTDVNGNTTRSEIDPDSGLTLKIINPDRSQITNVWDPPHALLRSTTDEIGRQESYTYTTDGRFDVETHTAKDGVLTTYSSYSTVSDLPGTVTVSAGGISRGTSYTFDAHGNIKSVTDPATFTTSYTYLSNGLLQSKTTPNGNLGASPDPSYTTAYTYNDVGQVLTAKSGVDASGTVGTKAGAHVVETDYTYDTTTYFLLTVKDPTGVVTTYGYDNLGNRTSTTLPDPYASGGVNVITTSTTYADNRPNTTADALGNKSTVTYDGNGRVIRATHPDGTFTTSVYDAIGNLIATTDELGRKTAYVYDSRNRRIETLNPDGSYEFAHYDGSGRVTAAIDANNNETQTAYDTGDRVLTQTDPIGQVTAFSYTPIGDPKTDAFKASASSQAYQTITFTTDNLGRVREKLVTGPNTYDAPGDNIFSLETIDYDADGNKTDDTQYVINSPLHNTTSDPTAYWSNNLPADPRVLPSSMKRNTHTTYDFLDRPIAVEQPEDSSSQHNNITQTSYDDAGRVLTTTDQRNAVTTRHYDFAGRLQWVALPDPSTGASDPDIGTGTHTSPTTVYTLDANGNQVQVRDASHNVTSYTYDTLGRLVSTTSPSVSISLNGVQSMVTPTTQSVYDPAGQLVLSVDANNNATYSTYDLRGRQLTQQSPHPDGTSGLITPVVMSTTYDAVGNKISTADGNGSITLYGYDDLNRLEFTITPAPNSTLHRRFSYNTYQDNNLIQVQTGIVPTINLTGGTTLGAWTRQAQQTTDYTYDAVGRKLSETLTDPDGAAGPLTRPTTTWTYDTLGNVLTVTSPLGNVAGADPTKHTTTYTYNAMSRKLTETEPAPDSTGTASTTTYTYDATGNLATVKDALNNVTTYEYDYLGRKTKQYEPDPNTGIKDSGSPLTTYTYDKLDNLLTTTDPLGNAAGANTAVHTTTYTYDALNRKKTETLPSPDGIQAGPKTSWDYDAAGNLTDVIDPDSNMTRYGYDALGRQVTSTISLRDPTTGARTDASRTTTYDANGDVLTYTDRNGRITQYTYDALNRKVTEGWAPATPGATFSTAYAWTYDDAGNVQNDSVDTYTYDALNRVTQDIGPTATITYTYDADGNRTSFSITRNGIVQLTNTYTYNNRDLVASISQTGGAASGTTAKSASFRYDADNRLQEIGRDVSGDPASVPLQSTWTYDDNGEVTALAYTAANGSGFTFNYTYDAGGRTLQFTPDWTQGLTWDGSTDPYVYTYDNDGQLTSANEDYPDANYTYDAAGNRTNTGDQTGVNNRLLATGSATYAYDAEGNRTRQSNGDGTQMIYAWDNRNRLSSVTFEDASGNKQKVVTYTYDAQDQRIGKTVATYSLGQVSATTAESYVNDGDNPVLVVDASGSVTGRYLFGPQTDQILADDQPHSEVRWMLTDKEGTAWTAIQAEMDGDTYWALDSFGNIVDPSTHTSGLSRFLFAGREYDQETGLYYNHRRYYDPAVGRFLSEDPTGFSAGDPNLYRYVNNEPVDFTDPNGTNALAHGAPFSSTGDSVTSTPDYRGQVAMGPIVNDWDYAQTMHDLIQQADARDAAAASVGNTPPDLISSYGNMVRSNNAARMAAQTDFTSPDCWIWDQAIRDSVLYGMRAKVEANPMPVGQLALDPHNLAVINYSQGQYLGRALDWGPPAGQLDIIDANRVRLGYGQDFNPNYLYKEDVDVMLKASAQPLSLTTRMHMMANWGGEIYGSMGGMMIGTTTMLPAGPPSIPGSQDFPVTEMPAVGAPGGDQNSTAGWTLPSLKGNIPDPVKWIQNGGRVTFHTDGGITYTTAEGVSVRYSATGYPDFAGAGLVRQQVQFPFQGNYTSDLITADRLAPMGPKLPTSTWHHVEDLKTMQEVDRVIHSQFYHSGGVSIKKGG